MLVGVGTDLAAVARLAGVLERHGPRFLRRAFHPEEIERYGRLPPHARPAFVAGRWAAKEAATKALGRRVLFPELRVVPGGGGDPRPWLSPTGEALEAFRAAGARVPAHLSISHDGDYATAVVVLERDPDAARQ